MDHLNFLHGGNISEAKRKYNGEITDFSANINPLGMPEGVEKVILNNLNKILHYPDPESSDLNKRIAWYWGLDPENILVGNGSVDLIYLIVSVFKPRTALITVPTFSEYERALNCFGCRIYFSRLNKEDRFNLDFSDLPETDIFFLCNPNNPTGNLMTRNCETRNLLTRLLIMDEAFMDFLVDEQNHTFVHEASKHKNIVVLRNLTKFFAMPGLRVGYLVGHKDTVERLKQCRVPWNINVFAQLAGEWALTNTQYRQDTIDMIKQERYFLFEHIKKIKGLKPYPSLANFLLIEIMRNDLNSALLKEELLKEGLLIRDCSNFRSLDNNFIRIAVRSHEENMKLIRALENIL